MSSSPSRALKPEVITASRNRLSRLRVALIEHGVDAALITSEKDIRYLTGFIGHDSLLFVGGAGAWAAIISDPRYDEFLDPWRGMETVDVVMGTRHRLETRVRELCSRHGVKTIGVQGEHVSIAALAKLEASLSGTRLKPVTGLVTALRMRKDETEIRAIETAIAIQQQALAAALDELRIGMTELEFSGLLDYHMKSRGATGESFEPIIGSGANSSIIHHATSTGKIVAGVLLVDWGAMYGGYCGDLTRTFGVGAMPAKLREIYVVVLEAQRAAIDAIAPGKVCAEIDKVARDILTKAGYGAQFGHGLGHGLGMDVHEAPYFNDLTTDVVLEPGMVMTVEPGVYVPGLGGVRIEDDVLVTEGGCRVLSDYPRTIDSIVLEPAHGEAPATAGRT
jgi:Xaa-Pro aminopeptidase